MRTFSVPGDGGLTFNVASAGTLVSPTLNSPPSPLDRLRMRGLSLDWSPARRPSLSAPDRGGNASVVTMADDQKMKMVRQRLKSLAGREEPMFERICAKVDCHI